MCTLSLRVEHIERLFAVRALRATRGEMRLQRGEARTDGVRPGATGADVETSTGERGHKLIHRRVTADDERATQRILTEEKDKIEHWRTTT